MNRRNPTRIEFKMDDLNEFEVIKKEREESKGAKDVAVGTEQVTKSGDMNPSSVSTSTSSSAIRTRATGLLDRL